MKIRNPVAKDLRKFNRPSVVPNKRKQAQISRCRGLGSKSRFANYR